MANLVFQACCPAAGAKSETGYLVPADSLLPYAGEVVDETPREVPPLSLEVALHEAAHAVHLHSRGYRISRVTIGQRNFVERAPGEGRRMTDLHQIEAALAGDVGALFAAHRMIHRPFNEEVDLALSRVASGCHGTCDHCIAGLFARHVASRSGGQDDALARDVWRVAEADVIDLLCSPRMSAAIHSLAACLMADPDLTGEAAHSTIEDFIVFGEFAEEGTQVV